MCVHFGTPLRKTKNARAGPRSSRHAGRGFNEAVKRGLPPEFCCPTLMRRSSPRFRAVRDRTGESWVSGSLPPMSCRNPVAAPVSVASRRSCNVSPDGARSDGLSPCRSRSVAPSRMRLSLTHRIHAMTEATNRIASRPTVTGSSVASSDMTTGMAINPGVSIPSPSAPQALNRKCSTSPSFTS